MVKYLTQRYRLVFGGDLLRMAPPFLELTTRLVPSQDPLWSSLRCHCPQSIFGRKGQKSGCLSPAHDTRMLFPRRVEADDYLMLLVRTMQDRVIPFNFATASDHAE